MMWYKYINKTSVKAIFCLHCYIPRIVCSTVLMQTQTQAPTVCENAKDWLKNKVKRIDLTLTAQAIGNVMWRQPMKMTKNTNIFEMLLFEDFQAIYITK